MFFSVCFIFDVYDCDISLSFQTSMNTLLDSWVNADLPDVCVDVAQKCVSFLRRLTLLCYTCSIRALESEFSKALTVGADPEKVFERLQGEVRVS